MEAFLGAIRRRAESEPEEDESINRFAISQLVREALFYLREARDCATP